MIDYNPLNNNKKIEPYFSTDCDCVSLLYLVKFFQPKTQGENTDAFLVNFLEGNVRMTLKHLAYIINIL